MYATLKVLKGMGSVATDISLCEIFFFGVSGFTPVFVLVSVVVAREPVLTYR